MPRAISRRTALLGFPVLAGALASKTAGAQGLAGRRVEADYKEDLFYREDWLGEPWRTPEPVGSNAPREMVEYWNTLFSRPDREGVKGLGEAMSKFDLAKEGVLQRISAPTLVITADRTKMHSVEEARAYQVQIPNSRLVVIRSDAYHIAAANADECVSHTLAFLKEQKQSH